MNNSPVLYQIVVDGVRATIQREDQGCSILLAPHVPDAPQWADGLELTGDLSAVRQALAEAETWLTDSPVVGKQPTKC